ncbi:diguanylate cyclase [Aeromonas salmonicida subsp. salmonicida]|uniref:diguanylate cyclase n=2 Tax=Aeromonas salmonicida TaxID=645 RepID=A4SKC3_AERS4|nr:GGDEF domain protein [Aeromonas salmonicida subsp. salmonicida A449]OAH82472.1 diguanylate cyclase [Aeromonas salmonicida subsp. salmonicida]ORJ12801.1 diguanylate cyclase [Aeromonas salmonicida]OAH86494.1 diguanylate cyclase [Aeromonas salmonicida subsp. salmonicida]OKA76849.1 diguanylate cyclase [Aeromonas salmonicida subsp. salmonicida]
MAAPLSLPCCLPPASKAVILRRRTSQPSTASCAKAMSTPSVNLSLPEQGIDLSRFEGARIQLQVEGPEPQFWRLYLRNYHPIYSRAGDATSHKFNEVIFRPDDYGRLQDVPLRVFTPATWWIQQYRIPLAQQGEDLRHVYAVEIASGIGMQPGHYRLVLERMEFYGRWVQPGAFYRPLLLSWLVYGLLLFMVQHLLMRDRLRKAREARQVAEARSQSLCEQTLRTEEEARYDPLTGALNRFGGNKLLAELGDMPLSFIYIDIDHFKLVNDGHGHPVGDEVLKHMVSEVLRHCDSLCRLVRWGGEEFVLVCLHYEQARAKALAERLRAALVAYPHWPLALSITASFGVAERRGDPLEQVLKRADEALYQAKKRGRNRVEVE